MSDCRPRPRLIRTPEMSRLTRGAAVATFAALGMAGLIAGSVAPPAMASSQRPAKASFLYVLQAREGWATRRPNGHWRLSLREVSVLEFSDRPVRIAEEVPVASFVSHWKELFTSPPNGAF